MRKRQRERLRRERRLRAEAQRAPQHPAQQQPQGLEEQQQPQGPEEHSASSPRAALGQQPSSNSDPKAAEEATVPAEEDAPVTWLALRLCWNVAYKNPPMQRSLVDKVGAGTLGDPSAITGSILLP